MPTQPIARVFRGDVVESIHTGHIFVIDGDGSRVFAQGDPATVTYIRSAAKPFQFIPCITSGAADAFNFTESELAISVASHSSEPKHIAAVASILSKAGLTEADLKCGSHMPSNRAEANRMAAAGEAPTQLHNNCSGKHSAMLAFAKHIGADLKSYDSADNRIQQRILRCVAELAEFPVEDIAIGIDGCSAPNFALPISAMARSFANLVRPQKFHESVRGACGRIVAAMTSHPDLIDGDGTLDTELMRAGKGKLISKIGAEGVWLCGVLPSDQWPSGLGIALKVADGDDRRARPVAAVELLRQLRVISPEDLTDFSPKPIRNRRGDIVGRTEAMVSEM